MDTLVNILLGTIGSLVAAELYAVAPKLSEYLINHAAKRLPRETGERYLEEWTAHLEECPGHMQKLWHAIGCEIASLSLSKILNVVKKDSDSFGFQNIETSIRKYSDSIGLQSSLLALFTYGMRLKIEIRAVSRRKFLTFLNDAVPQSMPRRYRLSPGINASLTFVFFSFGRCDIILEMDGKSHQAQGRINDFVKFVGAAISNRDIEFCITDGSLVLQGSVEQVKRLTVCK